ncbi:hypothetical protein FS837_005875 [Tulasnella sp. UAMH 9824]|nr:hypothetical protein FS837_005875 [Tulasnella sp. UAMH 9824]
MVSPVHIPSSHHHRSKTCQRLARELKVWDKAKHPNVLKLIGYYLSENYASAQLISPYMENGNITEYIKRTRPNIKTRLGFANVLIDEKLDAVLCDFGLATFIQDSGAASGLTTSRSTKGSTRYMSPELFQDTEAKHTLESDIWGWACTIFEILTDNTPYANALSDGNIVLVIVQGAAPGSIELLSHLVPAVNGPSLSELVTLQTLIPECWDKEPRKRPSSASIVERLEYDNPAPPSYDDKKYCQMDLKSRKGKLWVSEANTKPGVVLSLQDEVVHHRMSVSPDGNWLAAPSDDKVSMLWNLENLSTPPIRLPEECDEFAWSLDSQHLACLGFKELSIWSIRTQSSKGGCKSWVFSAAWFSDGGSLVVLDDGSLHVMRSESGEFRMGPSLLKIPYESASFPMATIVVISNCKQNKGDASFMKVVSQKRTIRQAAQLTMIGKF